MANPVVHFEIMATGDIEAVRRFYAEAFGWKIDANNPMNYGLVDNGGQGINGGIGQPMHGRSYQTFYVQVDDLRQALDRIESLGGSTMMPPMDVPGGGVSIAMFKDPAGNEIGLVKPAGMPPAKPAAPLAERELSITRVIDAPRASVFRAWTDTKQLPAWWGPHGMTTPVCEIDLRAGGRFRTVMRDSQGTEYPNDGVFLEVVEPARLVFTDAYTAGWEPVAEPFMTAVVTFDEVGGGKTKLTARALHRSVADREKHAGMGFAQGWGEMFERLATFVAKSR